MIGWAILAYFGVGFVVEAARRLHMDDSAISPYVIVGWPVTVAWNVGMWVLVRLIENQIPDDATMEARDD